ncbi:MAG: hypothetical protein U1F11_01055 [Steroidobacteraceae bacterium]
MAALAVREHRVIALRVDRGVPVLAEGALRELAHRLLRLALEHHRRGAHRILEGQATARGGRRDHGELQRIEHRQLLARELLAQQPETAVVRDQGAIEIEERHRALAPRCVVDRLDQVFMRGHGRPPGIPRRTRGIRP